MNKAKCTNNNNHTCIKSFSERDKLINCIYAKIQFILINSRIHKRKKYKSKRDIGKCKNRKDKHRTAPKGTVTKTSQNSNQNLWPIGKHNLRRLSICFAYESCKFPTFPRRKPTYARTGTQCRKKKKKRQKKKSYRKRRHFRHSRAQRHTFSSGAEQKLLLCERASTGGKKRAGRGRERSPDAEELQIFYLDS